MGRGSQSEDEGSGQSEAEAKAQRMRKKIYQEIFDSEKTYLSHLQVVVECFENPLRERKILADHVVVTIFSNIKQIIAINEELLQHLQTEGVGEAFLRISPFLKLYSTYANNHERALCALIEWDQKNAEFGVWRRAQEELPQVKGLKLNALLITPVQRIPRYRLLLEELLQNTSESCSTYEKIAEAKRQVSEVAEHINEHMKQHDNFMKMLAIQRSLTGHSAPRILIPGRIFIKEGALKKVSKTGGRSRERMFFLFSDMLMYTKPKWVENTSIGGYSCCCMMPLHHCRVSRVFGHSQGAGALFNIICKDESLLLYSDQKAVDSWMETLEKAISAFQARRQTLKKPSSAKKPMRGPALVKLRKKEKECDPLGQLRNSPVRSPNIGVKKTQERNWPCLSPRTESMSPADITKSNPPRRQRIFSCLTPRTDSLASADVKVTRSLNRSVGVHENIAVTKGRSSQRQKIFSCIAPRTESINAADIITSITCDENDPAANSASTSEKSNSGIFSLFPKQLFKRSLRKRKSSDTPKTPDSHKGKERKKEQGVTFGAVEESPVVIIEREEEDEDDCDSPVTMQYTQQFSRRPLSTITEVSEMSKWANQTDVFEDEDSEAESEDGEEDEVEGPIKFNDGEELDEEETDESEEETDEMDESKQQEEDDKVKEDIWQWHMQRQQHFTNSLRPPDDPLHQIHISPSSLDQGCCTNFNYRR